MPYEFHGDETPLSSDESPSFNDPAKSAILFIWHHINVHDTLMKHALRLALGDTT